MSLAKSSHSCLFGLGANCVVFFLEEPIIRRKKGRKCCPRNIRLFQGGNAGSYGLVEFNGLRRELAQSADHVDILLTSWTNH